MVKRPLAAIALVVAGCPSRAPISPADLAVAPPLCEDSTVGSDAAVAPSFANVQRLFDENCVGCHCCDAYLQLTEGDSWNLPRAETVFIALPECEQDLLRRWIERGAPSQ